MKQGNASEFRIVEIGSTHVADQNEEMIAVIVLILLFVVILILIRFGATPWSNSTDLGIREVSSDEGTF
jgi:hypothetical protein